jgi:hypothetical protein
MQELHTETADAPSTPRENKSRRRADTAADRPAGRPRADRNAIETRAYELYLERGSSDGDDVGDWLRAESELETR